MPESLATIVTAVTDKHNRDGTRLMQILREVQEAHGWLPPEAITAIASAIGWPRAKVESTAGFYSFFHTEPRGRYRVLWSDNITDRMLGNMGLMDALCKKLWLEPGRVSEDGLVSVDTTSCTGMCDQGPAVLVNYRAIPAMTMERVDQMVDLIGKQVPLADWPAEWFAVRDNVRRADILLNNDMAPGVALAACFARGPEDAIEAASNERSWREGVHAHTQGPSATLDEIKKSNLRGRGGAGFTTGVKWEACRHAPGETRYVVCNADEGEPGTFKDRVLLARQADAVVEGMSLAAFATGADAGFVYLRGEYAFLLPHLEAVLARRRAAGLLGDGFDITIHVGAGAYVCGEESALIESLEGKRGTPRIRPPFPVEHGYLGRPTSVNNVETFCAAAHISLRGGAWWAGIGTPKSTGTKIHSISGDCERPGLYEYPFGTRVETLLIDCGARDTQAVQVGGPSGTCLSASEFGRRICFEDVPTAGALMVFDRSRDMFEVVRNFAQFFAHESCGFCTPCRVGTELVVRRLDKLAAGRGSRHDVEVLYELDKLMHGATHCGLGGAACNPLRDTIAKFRPSYERHLKSLHFEPGFDLDAELSEARAATGRDDAGAHLESAHE